MTVRLFFIVLRFKVKQWLVIRYVKAAGMRGFNAFIQLTGPVPVGYDYASGAFDS